ncbi:hypothetical protein JTB14_024048 [Gonioctena quinquepunctata]|nr:hypothetical protein JTB14_024048 [Gonioctena quinquepunctata]
MSNTPNIEEHYMRGNGALKEKYQAIMEKLYIIIQNNQSIPPNSLPQMQLPIFNGSCLGSPLTRFIHPNQSIRKAAKLMFLKSQLRGDPQNLIKHLQIIESSYETAWNLSKDQYKDNRFIVAKLLDKIIDFPNIFKNQTINYKNTRRIK